MSTYRFSKQEVVVFGLDSQILEYGVGPKSLHLIPILDLAMSDRVGDAVARIVASRKSLITNEEVQIFCTSFASQIRALPRASG